MNTHVGERRREKASQERPCVNSFLAWVGSRRHEEGNNDQVTREVDGFATAHVWLDSRRPNYVDRTMHSDTNPTANGCAVLFLNWLHFQQRHSWRNIVAAAAPTLGKTYTKLTGRTDGFKQFKASLDSRFPVGGPSRLAIDNPFPL